jgi:UrcA family protein
MTTKILAALMLATLSAPSIAREMRIGPERYAVTVPRADLSSPTPALARRALRRIDRAATAACGGAGGSLRIVTQAIQASACWRGAVGDTVRRIDAPLLTRAWQDRRQPETRS